MIDLLKLGLILALTVVLLMRKWDLGLILLLNAGVVAVLFAYPVSQLVLSIGRGIIAQDTWQLAGAVFFVLVLAELMRCTRAMERMVESLQVVIPDSRVVLALMPTLIGLMPMLGGAMFSAPMVNELGSRLNLTADRKTFVNYWFRHSMEYVFPLYSSLLMIATLLGVSVFDFIRVSWPLSFMALLGGVLVGIMGIERQKGRAQEQSSVRQGWHTFFRSTWPLLIVILTVVVFKFNMLVVLPAVIVLFGAVKRIGLRQWPDILQRSFPIHTFSAIFGVMIFKQVLEDAGAVQRIPLALSTLGLPPLLVAFVVPLIIGLLTGTAAAAIALSVPLVAPLLAPLSIESLAAGVWMFVATFSGIMLSPMHLCLALTHDYFGANWGRLYRMIVPSVALVVIAALGIVWLR